MPGATRRTLDTILDAMLEAFPSQGRELGLRTYEGRVDDRSPAGLRRRAGGGAAGLPGGGRRRVRRLRQLYRTEVAALAGAEVAEPAAAAVAMRTDALIRAARLLCAVGMHTQGMTIDEATAEFETTAGLGPDHARLEAVRGAWDPGYFGYTLGKLEILALRDRVGGDLRDFHDALLADGTPPPAIAGRRLLGS